MKANIIVGHYKDGFDIISNKYLKPMFLGAEGKITDPIFMRDDIGNNISSLNKYYGELTGWYWLWKHADQDTDYLGSVQYRRYFKNYIEEKDIESRLPNFDIVIPGPLCFEQQSIREQFYFNHFNYMRAKKNLTLLEQAINDPGFTQYLDQKQGYFRGILIMKKPIFDEMCAYLFDVLFKLQKEIDLTQYSGPESRVMGFLCERLWGYYITKLEKTGQYKIDIADVLFMHGAA